MSTSTEQDLIFIHFWKFPVQPTVGIIREIDVFSTIYGPVIHDWEIRVGPDTFGAFRQAGLRNRHIQLRLRPAMFREHIAEATKCMFQMRVRDRQTGEEILSPEPCTVIPAVSERTQGFKVPHMSAIGAALIQLYHASTYAGRICEITSTLSISPAQFKITEWDSIAPPTPLHLDWRFRLLDDKSAHNFVIVCRDGEMFTSKEALYYCSPFFREFFNGSGREADRIELTDAALEAAKTVVTYMVTSSFSAPEFVTPSLVRDIYNLANRFDVMQLSSLMVAVERLGYLNVMECYEDMDVLIDWFLTAHECHMNKLQNAAVAYLTVYHQRGYIAAYGDGEQRVLNAQFSISCVRGVVKVEA